MSPLFPGKLWVMTVRSLSTSSICLALIDQELCTLASTFAQTLLTAWLTEVLSPLTSHLPVPFERCIALKAEHG